MITSRTLLISHFAYGSRAMAALLDALRRITPVEFTTVEASGNGSICSTLAHLLTAHARWVAWLDGSKPAPEAMRIRIQADDIPTVDAAAARWEELDRQTGALMERLTDEQLTNVWTAAGPNGLVFSLPMWQFLLHLANHGTHTRAQIAAAIRRTGNPPGVYEYLLFAVQEQQK